MLDLADDSGVDGSACGEDELRAQERGVWLAELFDGSRGLLDFGGGVGER